MFDIHKINETIESSINKNMEFAVEEINKSLSYPTYEGIIKRHTISFSDGKLNFSLELEDDFITEGQDIVRVLSFGGVFKKESGEFIPVPPNIALSKYLIH